MKKIATLLTSILLCFCSACLFSACGKTVKIVSACVKQGTLSPNVLQYGELDTSSVVVIADYEDGKQKEISSSELEFSNLDTETLGDKILTITYNDFSFDITITVVPAQVTGLSIKSGLPTELTQYDDFTLGDTVVEATYQNGAKRVISNILLTCEINTEVVGEQTLTVKLGTITTTAKINVKEAVATAAYIKQGTVENEVLVNTEFDTAGVVLVVTFENGKVREFTQDKLTITKPNTTEVTDNAKLKIQYKQVTVEKDIKVLDAVTTEFDIPVNFPTTVKQYSTVDLSEMQVVAHLSNGLHDTVKLKDLGITTVNTETVGTVNVFISYKGKTVTKTITVEKANVTDLLVTGVATEVYQYGTLNVSNINVQAVYEGNVTKDVNMTNVEVVNIETINAGNETLLVKFDGFTKEINITVKAVNITSVNIEGLQSEIPVETVFDTQNANITVNFDNADSVTGKASELALLTVSNLDASTVGTKEIIVTYNNATFKVYVDVLEKEEFVKVSALSSDLIDEFNQNRSVQNNKLEEFIDGDQALYVGSNNVFDLRLVALDENMEDLSIFRNEVTVEIEDQEKLANGDENPYTVLTGADLDANVSILKGAKLQFTNSAVGKNFRITVSIPEKYIDDGAEIEPVQTVVSVVDGYNVYNAKQLSVFDNYNSGWDSIKTELGIKDLTVNSVILQNKIVVTKDDVRQDLFWTKNTPGYETAQSKTDLTLEGTPIDFGGQGIYYRKVESGTQFNFIGNYFQVDLSQFPKMVVEYEGTGNEDKGISVAGSEMMTSHLCTFYTTGENITENTKVDYKNVYFYGNGALTADVVNSGAILLMKANQVNTTIYNSVTNNFYITYFTELGDKNNAYDGEFLIDSCKSYNSYQTLIYVWGTEHLIIKDCEFKNAGGPAMIIDHKSPKDDDGGNPSHVDVINSKIESKVTGKEPWFVFYNASPLAQQIVGIDAFFNNTQQGLPTSDKTIIAGTANENGTPVGQLNIVAIMKSGDAEGLTADPINGYTRFFKTEEDYNKYYGLNGEEVSQTTYGLDMSKTGGFSKKAMTDQVHYIQSNGNGGYINSGFNGSDNLKSSFVEGTVKAMTMKTILSQNPDSLPFLEGFDAKSLEEQKAIINTILGYVPDDATLTAIYQAGVLYGALDEVEGFGALQVGQKQEKLMALVNAFENKPYDQGEYLNLYLANGMGAILGLYEQTKE